MTKAVVLAAPNGALPDPLQAWADERSRLGHDHWDELWDGVLHMVPPPSYGHNDRGTQLLVFLHPIAASAGLKATYEAGVFRPGRTDDYRQPDLLIARPEHISHRGVEGRAELVVEIRSPHDEAWEKLPFFAEMGIPEVLILDADRAVLLRLGRDVTEAGTTSVYREVLPDEFGALALEVLPIHITNLGSGRFRVRSATGSLEI